jgi:3-oxoacyl-[acyl-carrier protein] reductase
VVEFINLNRKNIIITGTSNGIGLELARKFLKSGNFVWGCSRSKSNISHKNYKHNVLNLEKKNEIEKWIKKVSKESSNIIDLLILNAAYYERNLNYFETEKNIVKTISINLISSILIAKKISKLMIKNNSGMILFFSSSAVVVKDV